jgi:hypothetical protein
VGLGVPGGGVMPWTCDCYHEPYNAWRNTDDDLKCTRCGRSRVSDIDFLPEQFRSMEKTMAGTYELREASPLNPAHYNEHAIQPIEFIMANGLDFAEGCVVKYVSRWRKKNGVEDLKKARVYLDFLIKNAEEGKPL